MPLDPADKKKEFFASKKQLIQFAPYKKYMEINDGLYVLFFLGQLSFEQDFISKEKEKHKQLQQVQEKLNYSIAYVEIFDINKQTESIQAEKQFSIIMDEMVGKKINLSQWGFRVYNIELLQEEYEFRKEIEQNMHFLANKQKSQRYLKSFNEYLPEFNIFSVIHGEIEEVREKIILNHIKGSQNMNKAEIKLELQNIQSEIKYIYGDKEENFITSIEIKCENAFKVIRNLLQLVQSRLKSWVSAPYSIHFRQHTQQARQQGKNIAQDQIEQIIKRIQDPPLGKALSLDLLYNKMTNQTNDLMSLKKDQLHLCERIKGVIESVKYEVADEGQIRSVTRVLRVLEFKRVKMQAKVEGSKDRLNLFQVIYEGLTELVQQACRIIKINPVKRVVDLRLKGSQSEQTREQQIAKLEENYQVQSSLQNILDRLAISYFKQIATLKKGDPQQIYISFENGKKVELTQFLIGLINHTAHPQMWRDTFNKVQLAIKFARQPSNAQSVINLQNYQSYLPQQRLLNIKQNNLQCIGCYTYFTMNQSMPESTMAKVIYREDIKSIVSQQKEIKEIICKLINQNGGFILFNCENLLQKTISKGCYLNVRQKQQYSEKIEKIFTSIYPNPVKNVDYWISFVPIHEEMTKQNKNNLKKYEEETKENQQYVYTNQIQGVFITKIKICSQKSIKYNPFKILQQQQKAQTIIQQQNNPYCPRKFLLHKCFQNPQIQKQIQPQLNNYHILILRQSNVPNLRKRIQDLGIKFQFLIRFDKCKLPMMKFMTIMQHSQSHDYIMQNISNIYYDDRQILTIDVGFYIKLTMDKQITENQFKDIEKLFVKEFENQSIFFSIVNQYEYYVKTESKLATIFLYALFASLKFKEIVKDPDNYEDLTLLRQIPRGDQQ